MVPVVRGLLLVSLCWAFAASGAGMGYDEARQLLLRTGFAPTDVAVREMARLTRAEAVETLLDGTNRIAYTRSPPWVDEAPLRQGRLKDLPEAEKKALLKQEVVRGLELRAWWYQEMLSTPSPLTERMTLFWHNHFVSSQQKVKAARFMYQQNALLRAHALGNFGSLLHAVAKDPAMIIYLDGVSNRRGQPNENFAREVMELFTLGVGHYTESDVKEAARAFTGWSLDRVSGGFRFYPFLHDPGEKVILGRRGNFDGDDVLEILLQQPATAERIVTKLWREFVSAEVDAAEVRRLAGIFRGAHYELKPLLRALFLSNAFYAAENRAGLIKSPVELLVGTARQFGIGDIDARVFALAGRQLGQDLFGPPNVKGWPGGEDWINSATLLGRKQALARVFRSEEMPIQGTAAFARPGFDVEGFFAQFAGDERSKRAQIEKLVLASAPSETMGANGRLEFLRQLALDPVYQLK